MKKDPKAQEMKLLAKRLREARVASGLSQSEAAEKLKKPQSFVSRCESGTRRIDVFELDAFARLYGKPITHFIGGESK